MTKQTTDFSDNVIHNNSNNSNHSISISLTFSVFFLPSMLVYQVTEWRSTRESATMAVTKAASPPGVRISTELPVHAVLSLAAIFARTHINIR